ncbi:MAG: MoaD/ThiS family protein [Kofleriaceae bacterium]
MSFQGELDVEATTILAALHELVATHPQLRSVLLDAHGSPRAIHRLFLNGDLLGRDQLGQPVAANDELSIITAIAGG